MHELATARDELAAVGDREAARRLLGHYVQSMIDAWGRDGLLAASAETFTAIGTTGRDRTQPAANRLQRSVRIRYQTGATATIEWGDGTRQLTWVPRRSRRYRSTVPGVARTLRGHVLTFRVPAAEADALALGTTAPRPAQGDRDGRCSGPD